MYLSVTSFMARFQKNRVCYIYFFWRGKDPKINDDVFQSISLRVIELFSFFPFTLGLQLTNYSSYFQEENEK